MTKEYRLYHEYHDIIYLTIENDSDVHWMPFKYNTLINMHTLFFNISYFYNFFIYSVIIGMQWKVLRNTVCTNMFSNQCCPIPSPT